VGSNFISRRGEGGGDDIIGSSSSIEDENGHDSSLHDEQQQQYSLLRVVPPGPKNIVAGAQRYIFVVGIVFIVLITISVIASSPGQPPRLNILRPAIHVVVGLDNAVVSCCPAPTAAVGIADINVQCFKAIFAADVVGVDLQRLECV
jgi:hypothetical protein